ncbi:sperm motility kinase 2B-like, partial [Nannospalax galili]|uniref:sperm motility kinase 2B-like n=1 Tax=Nannospalax galili TaxID=1026970 RepID=UPI00111C8A5D
MSLVREEEEESEGPSPGPTFLEEEENFHSQYILMRTIGQGKHAKVLLAHHRLTGLPVAVKLLLKRKQRCRVSTEVKIMKMVRHPNIISLIQVTESEKQAFLVMELARGQQLFEFVRQAGCLQEDKARAIFRQILSGVGYCHDNGIVHRDLKPDNIMITEGEKVKILDFGISTLFEPGQELTSHYGTYLYAAPELYLGENYYGPKVDVWTLGVVLYFMVTGNTPFRANSLKELRAQILVAKYHVPSWISEELRDLLGHLLTVNPTLRPTVNEVKCHPWLMEEEEDLLDDWEDMIPSQADPAIVRAMEALGFSAQDINSSLVHRKFDQTMASYCLLHSQARQEQGLPTQAPPKNPGLTPFPTPEDPTLPLAPRRRRSEPALSELLCPPSGDEMADWGRRADRRPGRSDSRPAIALCNMRSIAGRRTM